MFAVTGVVPFGMYSTPCVAGGSVVTVTKSTVPSISVPVRSTGMLVSSLPDDVLGVATGGSFTSLTVITSFAGADVVPSSSVTVKAIVTVPLKLVAGTNTRFAASVAEIGVFAVTGVVPFGMYSTPCVVGGRLVTVTKSTVPSTSVPVRSTGIFVSSLPDDIDGVAAGGSLTATTEIVEIAVFEFVPNVVLRTLTSILRLTVDGVSVLLENAMALSAA